MILDIKNNALYSLIYRKSPLNKSFRQRTAEMTQVLVNGPRKLVNCLRPAEACATERWAVSVRPACQTSAEAPYLKRCTRAGFFRSCHSFPFGRNQTRLPATKLSDKYIYLFSLMLRNYIMFLFQNPNSYRSQLNKGYDILIEIFIIY